MASLEDHTQAYSISRTIARLPRNSTSLQKPRVIKMLLGLPKRFWAPKAGNVPEEYEDASNLASSLAARSLSADRALMAICDGASEAAFSREWANILTDAFVSRPLDLEKPGRACPHQLAGAVRIGMERSRAVGAHSVARGGQDSGRIPGGAAGVDR